MGPQHRQHPDIVMTVVQRLAGVANDAAYIELHVSSFCKFEVQVCSVVVTVVCVVIVV